jgi:hypothetical protein
MGKLSIKENDLESLGFQRRDLGDGVFDLIKQLKNGLEIWWSDGVFEFAHEGESIPLTCKSKEHLEQIINIL